ncbi:MAG: hypothetical protein ACP5FH_06060 [Terracidiphilus sp.]
MPQRFNPSSDSLIPPEPIPAAARVFSERICWLMDGRPKDEATVVRAFEGLEEMFEVIAARLYTLASMLVGEGEQSVRLMETAVANAEICRPADDPARARMNSRKALVVAALDLLAGRAPGYLAPPQGVPAKPPCCKEGGELVAAGISSEQLERAIGGPDHDRVRHWLSSLSTAQRTVFVLRAVAGFTSAETAALLRQHGGRQAAGWTPETVREVFRRGLCSLARQLICSSAAH